MLMTINLGSIKHIAPEAVELEIGESITTELPSSNSNSGVSTVVIIRLTEEYFEISDK